MKIDRLIGIMTLLLQNEKMTAPELAKRFEVSRRTINRDIEDLCKAGIPIVTTQGVNGGISIVDGYKIDKSLFTYGDVQAILSGLSSLESVSQSKHYQGIIDKFVATRTDCCLANTMMIDLASHYKATLAPQIELFKESIECGLSVTFEYINKKGKQAVYLDPYLIVFKWSNWYVFGYTHKEGAFRLYKLNRINAIKQNLEPFKLREIPKEALDFDRYFTDEIQAVILFDESVAYRLIEEYGRESYRLTPDGKLHFEFPFTNQDYLLSWVLSFGNKAELLEPTELRGILKDQLEKSLSQY
ncbi:MAG: helix-turn-helix transcriptional regulator [Cellulosilyticaceae bacterium]